MRVDVEKEIEARFAKLVDRHPRDRYHLSEQPILRVLQRMRPRCSSGCRCLQRSAWYEWAGHLLPLVERPTPIVLNEWVPLRVDDGYVPRR